MKYEINDNFGAALIRSQFVVLRHIFAISDKDQTLKITKNSSARIASARKLLFLSCTHKTFIKQIMRIADRNCVAMTNSYRISVATVFGILDSSLWYQCSCTSKYLFAALRHSISFVYDDRKTHWVNSWPHFRVLGRREWMIGKQLFIIRKYYMFFVR